MADLRVLGKDVNSLLIVIDFDGTLTTDDSPLTHETFPEDTVLENNESLYDAQREMNERYMREAEDIGDDDEQKLADLYHEWWMESQSLIVDCHLDREVLRECIERLEWRDDALELLTVCEEKNIPVIMLTGGISDVIAIAIVLHYGRVLRNLRIIGNEMEFDENGMITGFIDRVVHSKNKTEIAEDYTTENDEERNLLVVGDSEDDARILENWEKQRLTYGIGQSDDSPFDLVHSDFSELIAYIRSCA